MRCRLSLPHDLVGNAVNGSEGCGKMVRACDSRHDTGMALFGNLREKFV
jgi:hypothetical protein